MKKFMLMFFLAAPLMAQEAKTTPKETPPELSALEKKGLTEIAKEYQQVMQEFSQANIDIEKAHPGYHLDPKAPLSGVLVKDEAKAPAKVESKAESKTDK